ncbi:hypothetical protein MAR_012875, partial [Mya arenaria]
MIGYTTALFALVAATLVIAGKDELVKCTPGVDEIIGKADCTGYYLCVFGKAMDMTPCPPGYVFSSSSKVCVPKGSIKDDCKKTTEGSGGYMTVLSEKGHLSPEERCSIDSDDVFPHPTECQAFYNCSVYNKPSMYQIFEQHLDECPYPQLFNTETKQCDHFENVNTNATSKGDGINVDPVRLWTPYYAVCYKERFDKKDQCQVDEDGRTQFFHPERNKCVPLDMIPREHGGLMPECGTKVNGGFLDVFGRCDRYAYCQGGKYIGTIKCDVGEVFDELKGGCVPERNACGVCSTHSN